MTKNKYYPAELEKAILKSLSFYPELTETEIHFRYVSRMKNSVMQAQPLLRSIFRGPPQRSYVIKMSSHFFIDKKPQELSDLPFNVLVGWLGHELGHIMDYLPRSLASLAGFGAGYILSQNFMKGAERMADIIAVNHGMGKYIQATKDFILNQGCFSEAYKNKIRKLYPSPEEILRIIEEKQSK